jgi:2-methylisocitrate lyase-like PEP mutase family enzyme
MTQFEVFRPTRSESVSLPGVYDPLSALLARQAGFEAVFLSGFAVAGAFLGRPDVGLLTQTEVADVTRRVSAAVPDLALIVDADTGYGNAANVRRTVGLWEQAGAAGLFLEDQVWPKRCGHMAGKEVVDRAAWVAKLRGALSARTQLHITARTDARAPLGLDEAIERGKMARDVGVDAVFVEAPQTADELERIGHELADVVLVANMVEAGRTPLMTPSELIEVGFSVVVMPVAGVFAAAHALNRTYRQLAASGTMRNHLDQLAAFDEFTDLVGLPALLAQAELDDTAN